jgi:hypothetical protein
MSDAIEPFEIDVPDRMLEDLKHRLAATRFPQQIEGTGWDYGADLATIRELVAYWKDEYGWRAHEAALNRFPQFTTVVDDQRIHFIHARSRYADATPIILMHGWPGRRGRVHEPATPSPTGARCRGAATSPPWSSPSSSLPT